MKNRTLAEGTQIKAILDATEAAPALGKGQPVVVTKWPADTTVDPYTVKTCPDGQVPDFVVGRTAVSGSPVALLFGGERGLKLVSCRWRSFGPLSLSFSEGSVD